MKRSYFVQLSRLPRGGDWLCQALHVLQMLPGGQGPSGLGYAYTIRTLADRATSRRLRIGGAARGRAPPVTNVVLPRTAATYHRRDIQCYAT